MNRLVLTAQLAERGALRYTPAGLPALDLSLKHESQATQDGQVRQVWFDIRARVIGTSRSASRRWSWEAHTALPASWALDRKSVV